MKTVHIDMSYIVASILATKNKYYNETHCTFKECNAVTNELRKKLYNAVINNNIILKNLLMIVFRDAIHH